MKVRWRILAMGLAIIGISLGGVQVNAQKYGDVPQSQTFQVSRTKPIYAFDFSEKKKRRIANMGTGVVEALLKGKASVAKDTAMGKCLSGKAGEENCFTLNENAFEGITEALSVSFWVKAKARGKGTIFATESERNNIRIKLEEHLVLEVQSQAGTYVVHENVPEDWTHIGFALNGEKVVFYVNGVAALNLNGEEFTRLFGGWDLSHQDNYMAAGAIYMDNIEIYAGMLTKKDFKQKYKTGWKQIQSARATPKPEVTPEPTQPAEEQLITAEPVDMQGEINQQNILGGRESEEQETPWAVVAVISVVIVGIGVWAILMSRKQKR